MSIGIVGYGSFGAFLETLAKKFLPDAEIKIHSSRFSPDGSKFFSLADVAQCDAVVLAVPISAYEETLQKLVPLLDSKSIVVDVATVKVYTVGLLRKYLGGRPFVATHPMFGPESYQKKGGEITGLRIVVCGSTLDEDANARLGAFLAQCGFDLQNMDPDKHDQHLAQTLFLTHFVGQVVSRGGFNRTDIDTVSFGYLMDAMESIKHDTALFKDVYKYNPYCEEVLRRFEDAEARVHTLLKEAKIQE